MIRVLQVLPTLKRAGAERVAVSLARLLDRDRFQSKVVSLYGPFPGGFESVLEADAIPCGHLGKRKGLDLRMIPALRNEFRSWHPDIIQTHSYLLRYVLPASWGYSQGRIVHTVHNEAAREVEWAGRMVHRLAYRTGVTPVAVGPEVARTFQQMYGFAPAAVIPNGIDLKEYRAQADLQSLRADLRLTPEQRVAISVARLEPQKNPLGLVDAFARGLHDQPDWVLLLVGDGSLRQQVSERIAEINLHDRVRLLGVQPKIPALLALSDMFVMASHWEGRPMAVMEAMAARLPVVATAVGGIAELVHHEENGLLTQPGDIEALANAIRRVASDNVLRQNYSNASGNLAEAFSVETMVGAYSGLYEQLARGRS
jgi:glycosyltransferase involved in cell wall biosynthesis